MTIQQLTTPQFVLTIYNEEFIGTCSSCSEAAFRIEIETYDEDSLKRAFGLHLKTVHTHEDR
jgi:hypothetical protein